MTRIESAPLPRSIRPPCRTLCQADFLAGVLRAVDFFAGIFLEVDVEAVDFLAVPEAELPESDL